jgi:hypothetical protein
VPDDLSALDAPTGGLKRTALLLPLAKAEHAVRLVATFGLEADAVPTTRGVLVVAREVAVDDALVARISGAVKRADLLVLRLAEERVAVERWRAGALVDRPAYGLIGGLDGDAERVLLGLTPVAEAAGVLGTDGIAAGPAPAQVGGVRAGSTRAPATGRVATAQLVVTGVLLAALAVLFAGLLGEIVSGGTGVWLWVRVVVVVLLFVLDARRVRVLLHHRRR